MLMALTKFLTLFKSLKIITFSHLNSTNAGKMNKMTSNAGTLNICALEPN